MLALQGAVDWPPTLVMMVGATFGGLMGGRLGRVIPQAVMRVCVIAFGALLTAIYSPGATGSDRLRALRQLDQPLRSSRCPDRSSHRRP